MVLQGGLGMKQKMMIMDSQSRNQDERTPPGRTSSDSTADEVESLPDGSDQ